MVVMESPSRPGSALLSDNGVLDGPTAAALADLFKVLADPTRVRMIAALAGGELCVNDLAAALDMEQSAVSHQLRALREWRLVRRRRVGRQVYYRLDDRHVHDMLVRSLEHVQHR